VFSACYHYAKPLDVFAFACEIILRPTFFSISFRMRPAAPPPHRATFRLSLKPTGCSFFEISALVVIFFILLIRHHYIENL
jgi:hypothetical protein